MFFEKLFFEQKQKDSAFHFKYRIQYDVNKCFLRKILGEFPITTDYKLLNTILKNIRKAAPVIKKKQRNELNLLKDFYCYINNVIVAQRKNKKRNENKRAFFMTMINLSIVKSEEFCLRKENKKQDE